MKTIFPLLLPLLLVFAACKKGDGSSLPDVTNNGANTFGCRIDGSAFSVSGDPNANWEKTGVTFIPSSSMYINAHQGGTNKMDISFHIPFDTGSHHYIINTENQAKLIDYSKNGLRTDYITDNMHTGVLDFH